MGSHSALAVLKLITYTRLALDPQRSACLCLTGARIKGVHQYTQLNHSCIFCCCVFNSLGDNYLSETLGSETCILLGHFVIIKRQGRMLRY